METQNVWTVLVTAITVLGSASAWRFYEKKAEKKREDELSYRYDCKERISKLEYLLEESSREKEEMRKIILELTKEVAELRTKIEYLEKEQKNRAISR
jgi:predicted RNase H-like nuclease (RuvC/YqgF family)